MKLRNFANKLLLVILMMIVGWGQAGAGYSVAVLAPLADDAVAVAKTYYFDQYNDNVPTEESLYDALGIKVYNDYLSAIDETKGLEDVVIAVVDSGLNPEHPVFKDRILTEYGLNFSQGLSSSSKSKWYDWDEDHNGHGTHVAGIIADLTLPNVKILPIKIFHSWNNQSSKYAFDNAIRYICALKSGDDAMLVNDSGEEFYECNSDHNQLNIVAVNLSLGTDGYEINDEMAMNGFENDKYGYTKDGVTYSGYQDVIDALLREDVLPIVAAGNYGNEDKNRAYYSLPGSCDGVLAVSAYDNTEEHYQRASFAFYNNFVGISAPGTEIWSACSSEISALIAGAQKGSSVGKFSSINKSTDKNGAYTEYIYNYNEENQISWILRQDATGNFYLRNNGTSMATPFVSACYAMLSSDTSKESETDFGLPAWDGAEGGVDEYFMNPEHKALLAAASTYGDRGSSGYDVYFGYGTINVACFAQATVDDLLEIEYEITPSYTYKEELKAPITFESTDWFEVAYIMLFGGILVWGFGYFRSYFNRRRTHESNESE